MYSSEAAKAKYARQRLDPEFVALKRIQSKEAYARNKARYAARKQALQRKHRRTPLGQMQHIVYGIRGRCKRRGLSCDLDTSWVISAASVTHCQKSGLKLRWGHDREVSGGHVDPLGPSVDRVNPRRGYTKKNVRVVAYFVNSAKMSMSEKEFDAVMRAWSKQYR